tara:strand:+ start:770 stop:1096 length:327 start_codon:yes stop_codon:yes gene_type:complete
MAKARALLNVIEHFRLIDSGMHAQSMSIFLYVAEYDPKAVAMQEIAQEIGVSQASVSRNVALLSSTTRYRTKGPNLLQAAEDPNERRSKLVTLTHKGRKFYNDLEKLV